MIWKVYAQCVRKPVGKAITKITYDDLKSLIEKEFSYWINRNVFHSIDFDDDSVFDNVFDAFISIAESNFKKYGLLGFGDFDVVESEEMPMRPNMASDIGIEESDILKYIKGEN